MKPFYRHSLNAIVLVVVAASSVASAAQTNYYRWLDSSGNPIVSDRPPPAGTDYEVVSTAVNSQTQLWKQKKVPFLWKLTPRRATNLPRRTRQRHSAARRMPNCAHKARANLEALSGTATVTIRDSQGEVKELDPQEMQIQRTTTKAQIKVYCAE